MRYKSSLAAGVLVGALSATAAQANVVYEWNETAPGPDVTATGGELVFTDAAYRSGSIDYHYQDPTAPSLPNGTSNNVEVNVDTARITNSPLISADVNFESGYPGSSIRQGAPGISVMPYETDLTFVSFGTDVMFNDDGTLAGSIFLYSDTGSTRAEFAGAGENWSAFNYGSDYFGSGECGPSNCDAGSGYWQLARTSADVAAPPTAPLLGLSLVGLAALIGVRRRNQRS